MSNLFNTLDFTSHSGIPLDFKIDCDALTDEDLEALAFYISKRIKFSYVHSVPKGGDRLATALKKYETDCSTHLIVDDVLTTGKSMNDVYEQVSTNWPNKPIRGIVIFNRQLHALLPAWVQPIFTLSMKDIVS